MKKEAIDLSAMNAEALAHLFNDRDVLMRVEVIAAVGGYKAGVVTRITPRASNSVRAEVLYDDGPKADLRLELRKGEWLTTSDSRKLVAWRTVRSGTAPLEPGRPPKLLAVGDIVRIDYNGKYHNKHGTVEKIDGAFACVRVDGAEHVGTIGYKQESLTLVCSPSPIQATPVEPEKKLKDNEFSEQGVLPSDMPGINEMLKKGFKEIFGGDMTGAKAPAKRTLPSSKALFITASEKYMGLGFNDGHE